MDCSPPNGAFCRLGTLRGRMPRDDSADAQKNELKPHLVKMWCIPPKANAEFVWRMEDVLEVYKRPFDPLFPVVCMDETSKQLVGESRPPEPLRPGKVKRQDAEY